MLHAAGAPRFGSPWPGFIATLPLGDRTGDAPTVAGALGGAGDWASWYGSKRLLPYLRRAADTGALTTADARLVEQVVDRLPSLAGPPEPPSRIHGDCWSGNVLWSGGRGWLIDPAAQGGHRETDLAMLALFGAPYLDRILGRLRRRRAAGRGLAGPGPAAPAAPAAGARLPVRQRLRRSRPPRRAAPLATG